MRASAGGKKSVVSAATLVKSAEEHHEICSSKFIIRNPKPLPGSNALSKAAIMPKSPSAVAMRDRDAFDNWKVDISRKNTARVAYRRFNVMAHAELAFIQ